MGYKEGSSRYEISFMALEDMVDAESMVRIIDRYVEMCDFKETGGRFRCLRSIKMI